MPFKGNKQTATYHDLLYVQDRCAIDKMPADKLIESDEEFDGPVADRKPNRAGEVINWKICAHCKRARDKALAPEQPAEEAPKPKRTRKPKPEAEAAPVIDAADGQPEAAVPPVVEDAPAPVDLFADAPAP